MQCLASSNGCVSSADSAYAVRPLPVGSETVDVHQIVAIAKAAGEKILQIYSNTADWDLQFKADSSPLTNADQEANKIICEALARLYPSIPIVSEENAQLPFEQRGQWRHFWVVDPLDGTKEFVKRNGQFTVNIGLCEGPKCILGVVHVPVQGKTYWAVHKQGAYRQLPLDDALPLGPLRPVERIRVAEFDERDEGLTIVASLSHLTEQTKAFVAKYKNPKVVNMGSSIKFLLIADGTAHVYPRFAPTQEWDTCASQAIVEEAGGQVLQASGSEEPTEDGQPVVYNKRSSMNPSFVVYGKRVHRPQLASGL